MQLSYRGLSYEANSRLVDSTESNVTAQYRGLSYQVHRPVNKLGVQSPIALKFRGTSYIKF
jgi:hypothetical protein